MSSRYFTISRFRCAESEGDSENAMRESQSPLLCLKQALLTEARSHMDIALLHMLHDVTTVAIRLPFADVSVHRSPFT